MLLNLNKTDGNILIIPAQRFLSAEGPEKGPTTVTFSNIPPTDPLILVQVKETPQQLNDLLKSIIGSGGGCGQGRQIPPGMTQGPSSMTMPQQPQMQPNSPGRVAPAKEVAVDGKPNITFKKDIQ
jgi:hypothetical protein